MVTAFASGPFLACFRTTSVRLQIPSVASRDPSFALPDAAVVGRAPIVLTAAFSFVPSTTAEG